MATQFNGNKPFAENDDCSEIKMNLYFLVQNLCVLNESFDQMPTVPTSILF